MYLLVLKRPNKFKIPRKYDYHDLLSINDVCFILERAVVFEMVCQNRGGLVQMCDANGDYKCKCDRGTVYDSQTKTCRPTG